MKLEKRDEVENKLEQNSTFKTNRKKRNSMELETSTSKKRKVQNNLYKQPTVEELNQLRETENLFHSNLFRLQIEEILSAVKIKKKYTKLFETWFEKFKNHILSINDTERHQLQDDVLFNNSNIKIPMETLPNDCLGTFKFVIPSNITIGGSYSLDTIVGPDASVDIFVEMPKILFNKADSKNYRYMRKKAMYLAYIGSKIDEDLVQSKSFVGNHNNCILKIIPSGKLGKQFIVYIHVVVQESTFTFSKFTPETNNVNPSWFFKEPTKTREINPPTPFYNNIIIRDLTMMKVHAYSSKIIKEYPNIRDGIILLKIWLKQRDFCNNFESFNGHIISMFVLYLLHIKKLNTFMSSYQIVRNTWQNLANINWCKEGISFCEDEKINERIIQYHKYYECVFLDSTGFHNLAANILENTFAWISNQAQIAVECLNNTRINGFQILFMRKVPIYKAFDCVINLYNVRALDNIIEANSTEENKLNYGSNKYEQAVKLILKVLKQGLGNRISFISIIPRKIKEWNLNDEIPNDLERLFIGLQLNPDFSFNIIDKGPLANLPEAQLFRRFWESKSELRRFKDGTICETIVWAKEGATFAEKRKISQKIVKYLMEAKLKLFETIHYCFFMNEMDDFIKLQRVKWTKFRYGPEEAALQIINTFNALEKELRGLTDLPLSINGVQGCSPSFRFTEVFPPLSSIKKPDKVNILAGKTHLHFAKELQMKEVPLYLAPIEATIQLSTSGKWPEDLEALRMTKAAFHIQIADCMRKQHQSRIHGSAEYVDVMKNGLLFRLRIAHQKEVGLLKQQIDEGGVIKYRDNDESRQLEMRLFHLPKLNGALYGLHCQQPSFGPACCLAKRWLSAQLIDNFHMPDIVVELLMASVYLNPQPYTPAQIPQAAFLRFLETFATEQWNTDPVIINFNNEMSREEIVEVENLFGTSRDTLPPLFIATPYDKSLSIWTKKAPNLLIINRITSLAKEALRLLEAQLFNNTNICCDPIFSPPLSEYDCLIQLKEPMNPRRFEAILTGMRSTSKVDLHPYKEHSLARIPIIGFDPVAEYLKELRAIYNEFALFFHDTYGGCTIGVLMKPQAYQEKEFKVSITHCQKLNSNGKLVLNVSTMIEDFYLLGKGLVETINVQSQKINEM